MLHAAFTDLTLFPRNGNGTDNSTTMATTTSAPTPAPQGPNVVAIVVPIVVIALLIMIVVIVIMLCVVRKKRQTEGTYRPSSEEQTGARSVEAPNTIKLPKEERLI